MVVSRRMFVFGVGVLLLGSCGGEAADPEFPVVYACAKQ